MMLTLNLKPTWKMTGYSYEPWHIRYVDSVDIAKEIAEKGETLEEYLGDAVLKK